MWREFKTHFKRNLKCLWILQYFVLMDFSQSPTETKAKKKNSWFEKETPRRHWVYFFSLRPSYSAQDVSKIHLNAIFRSPVHPTNWVFPKVVTSSVAFSDSWHRYCVKHSLASKLRLKQSTFLSAPSSYPFSRWLLVTEGWGFYQTSAVHKPLHCEGRPNIRGKMKIVPNVWSPPPPPTWFSICTQARQV